MLFLKFVIAISAGVAAGVLVLPFNDLALNVALPFAVGYVVMSLLI